jgi:hypothetical protein
LAKIPPALEAHERAQEVSDEIRLTLGPWTADGNLPEWRRVAENQTVAGWRIRLAEKSPAKAPAKRAKGKTPKPTPAPVSVPEIAPATYCVAPSCAHVAKAGSQYCDAHNGAAVEWRTEERADGSRVNVRRTKQDRTPSGEADPFRMYRWELEELGTPEALAEIARRDERKAAKRAAKKGKVIA